MKRFSGFALASALLFFAAGTVAEAEMVTIYGPVYVSKTKQHHGHGKESKFTFSAPLPGPGVIVVKNGGDSGKKARVGSAEIEFNGVRVARPKDFNKNVTTLSYNVTLSAENKMEVEVESCKECEIEITVLGESAPAIEPPPPPPLSVTDFPPPPSAGTMPQ